MANMNDFDLIFELSPRALVEMIRPQLMLNGINYDPPAEIAVMVPGGGEIHFVLTDLSVSIRPEAGISITFSFERGSLIGRPGRPDLTSLEGRITINSRLTLDPVPMQPTRRMLTLHLRRIERAGRVVDSSSVTTRVPASSEVASLILLGLQQTLDALPTNPSIVLPLQVDPMARGSINPPVFRDLRLGSIGGEGRQSLVLFANLLPGPASRGNVEAWRTTSLASDDVSLLISPQLFHEMIFKPQVQSSLRVADPDLLPPTCGRAESVPYPSRPEVSITRVAETMRDGRVEVEIRARQRAGDDGDAGGFTDLIEVRGSLTIEVRPPNQLLPRWRTDEVHGGTHFGWAIWLLGILTPFHWLMALRAGLADSSAAGAASLFDLRPDPISVPPLVPFTLRTAEISPDHLRLAGTINPARRRSPSPTLQLSPTLTVTSRERVDSGTYESMGCPDGQYQWERWRQNQVFTCRPSTTLASLPVRYRWQIMTVGGGAAETLRGPAGGIERTAECFLPEEIPARRVMRTVRIEYEISASGAITLRNRPEDGVFHVGLICTATDADDHNMEQQAHFDFAGDQITLGARSDGTSTWAADFEECVRHAGTQTGGMRGMGGRMLDQMPLPHWILVHRPPPWELTAFVIAALLMPDVKAAQTLLGHAATLYGPSMVTYMDASPDLLATIFPSDGKLDIGKLVPDEMLVHSEV